ncbi:toxin [Paraburkholderia acidisoli]|uniref:Toxin n=1 Tax=Paraburkholderia acidisoli TaxID=2571748 RepID=A0A7Z2JG82_9BURK|nr:toxin [Paraburkholderia acidisoli]QGZ62678.1 toxin [Paraburkholderia acidisoli]
MNALFVELSLFRERRAAYLDDEAYRALQNELLANPEKGDLIRHTHGLRKVRWKDARRGKGKRGGLRVIYYHWVGGAQFWMFFVYDKDEVEDLNQQEAKALGVMLRREMEMRTGR